LQEEERERKMDFVPERSCLDLDKVEVDADTRDLMKSLDFGDLAGVVTQSANSYVRRDNRKPWENKGGKKL
jgi:small subunit ribosomal protein S17e